MHKWQDENKFSFLYIIQKYTYNISFKGILGLNKSEKCNFTNENDKQCHRAYTQFNIDAL